MRARHAVAPALVFEPSTAPMAGETLDVDPAPVAPDDQSDQDPANAAAPAPAPGHTLAPAPAPTHAPASSPDHALALAHAPGASSPASPGAASPAAAAHPALFGAAGVRYATDLATTFTRAFPQTASADSIWGTVPIGNAGTAEVSLVLDESGHLASHSITGSPSPALRRGIERTLVVLGPRAFTARGALTRLRVTARVGKDDVHDGLHGEVFALSGGSFSGDVGTAFFALPAAGGGRRIDVELRLLP
jgi:hypothetical protein